MVVWLVAVPLGSTKCILIHSRAQERDRLTLVKPRHQETAGPVVCLPWVTGIYPAWSACVCGVLWPPPPSGLTCIWPQERPLVGHLLDWACDMKTFLSQIWDLHQWMLSSGIRAGVRETDTFSLASESGPPTAWIRRKGLLNIFSSVGHVTNYSKVKRLHLWVWILIVLRLFKVQDYCSARLF